MISGIATSQKTKEYSEKFPELTFQDLGTTGLWVSQAGFGSYRVDVQSDSHRKALRKALRSGVNLIDTSANYTDGNSEELIGETLQELIQTKELLRESVVIVSKVGYLQGQNYELSQKRKLAGKAFPDLVIYADGLEHCIHPEFIEDQLTRSLIRLRMKSLDVYLLHNPEYFLEWAHKNGTPLEKARSEYYRRIEAAFRHLEEEVKRGRIQFYGVSSNTFPVGAREFAFTSLEEIWNIAEKISSNHHFRVIQFPMNLFETGAATCQNQRRSLTVLEFAREKNLGILINRPLNAFSGNEMIRLAEVREINHEGDADVSIHKIRDLEVIFKKELLPTLKLSNSERKEIAEAAALGETLAQFTPRIRSYYHWLDIESQYFAPTANQLVEILLKAEGLERRVSDWLSAYLSNLNELFLAMRVRFSEDLRKRMKQIKSEVAALDPDWQNVPTLSQLAIRALRSTSGITCVLVGMRQEAYVDDVLMELRQKIVVQDRLESWNALLNNRAFSSVK